MADRRSLSFAMAAGVLAAAVGWADAARAEPDPFDELVKVCAAKNPQALPAAMTALHATELDADTLDLMRFGQTMGLSIAILHMDKSQEDVDRDEWPVAPEYFGWQLGRVRLMTATDPKGAGRVCMVSAAYDRFDDSVALLRGMLGYGEPARDIKFGVSRVVAWNLKAVAEMPEAMVLTADFGGEHKPTTVQIFSK